MGDLPPAGGGPSLSPGACGESLFRGRGRCHRPGFRSPSREKVRASRKDPGGGSLCVGGVFCNRWGSLAIRPWSLPGIQWLQDLSEAGVGLPGGAQGRPRAEFCMNSS